MKERHVKAIWFLIKNFLYVFLGCCGLLLGMVVLISFLLWSDTPLGWFWIVAPFVLRFIFLLALISTLFGVWYLEGGE